MLNKSRKTLTILGIGFLVTAAFVTSVYLIYKSKNTPKPQEENKYTVSVGSTPDMKTFYTSELFGYKVNYPESLSVRELGSGGGYIDFVRFEENVGSEEKGFAIGVSELSFENEIERIKAIFKNENALLVEETSFEINGNLAWQLLYKPQDYLSEEDRVVVIFNNGKFTFSISTIPWHIEEVLGRFQFL